MAQAKKRAKRKTPSAARKRKVMGDAVRKAVRDAMEMTKKAEEAKAQAQLKVFAAKLIAHISKEAGIKGPPASVKRAAVARAKKKAAVARKKAQAAVAAAKKKAAASQVRARRTTGR